MGLQVKALSVKSVVSGRLWVVKAPSRKRAQCVCLIGWKNKTLLSEVKMDEQDENKIYELYFMELWKKERIEAYFGGKYTYKEISELLKAAIRGYDD